MWVVEFDFELSQGWYDEFLTILPNSGQILFNFDSHFLTIVYNLLNCEIIVWHLNLNDLLPLLLRWVLHNNQSLIIMRVARFQIIIGEMEVHVRVKLIDFNTILVVNFLNQQFCIILAALYNCNLIASFLNHSK